MALSGEVTLKINRAILIAEKFTISQLADITGLKYESVETVVQRLLKEGIISRVDPIRSLSKGRPKQQYAISAPSKAIVLRNRVQAFSLERSIIEPIKVAPRNPHFLKAVSILKSIETSKEEASVEILKVIEENLSIAREYEETFDENNQIAIAYVDFAQARLENIKGEGAEADKLLKRAKSVFQTYMITEEHAIDDYFIKSKLDNVIYEIKKALTSNNFNHLPNELNGFIQDFADKSFVSSIGEEIKGIIQSIASLSLYTSSLIKENNEIKEQNYFLRKDNEQLNIQQQLFNEINRNFSETLKNISESQEFSYPKQELPSSSFIDMSEMSSTIGNVNNLFRRNKLAGIGRN